MLKGQLFQLLNQYLGEYLYGFNPDQLRLAFLNGNMKLKNLTFRPDKVNDHLSMMRSPVILKAGIIGNITVDINIIDWSKKEIILEDLLIILGPNFSELKERKHYVSNEEKFLNLANRLDEYSRQGFDTSEDPYKRGLDMHHVMGHEEELNRLYRETKAQQANGGNEKKAPPKEAFGDFKGKVPEDKKDFFSKILGFFEGKKDFFSMILGFDFLDILTTRFVAKNIHIRYEDDQLVPRHPISFGFLIESILLHPNPNMDIYIPSSKDSQALGYYNIEKKVLDDFWKTTKERKNLVQQLLINNVEIYLNSASEMYVPYSLYEETLYSPNGIFEAIPPLELKALMKQYLEHDDIYKFTLFKIERIELHCMISSNLKPEPNRQNFLLLNSTMFNVYFNLKPDSVEDLLDMVNYFQHFAMWKHFNDFKPPIRPILSARLVNSKPAAQRMRKIVLREWWRSILWYIRVKKLIDEGREDTIPELYVEYCKSSWIKILEDFRLRSRDVSIRDYSSAGLGGDFRSAIWDQASSKKIFHEEEPKEREAKSLKEKLQSKEVKGALDKIKNILIMFFCNIYNFNVAVKKNNGKTFLLKRIDQTHVSAMINYDFKDSNIATFQLNNIRLFLCQTDKQKKIFEGGAHKETQDLFKSAALPKTKQAPINQDLRDVQRVMERSSTVGAKGSAGLGTPFSDQLAKSSIQKDSPGLGTLATPMGMNYKSPQENYPNERAPIFQHSHTYGPEFKKKLEDDLKKSSAKPSADLLLLELQNDIILKFEVRPSGGQGIQFQIKTEINEINVNLDSEIMISIFEYINDINKIYYIRTAKTTLAQDFENLKYQAQKKVITFQRPSGMTSTLGFNQTASQTQNKSNILVKDDDILKRSMTSKTPVEPHSDLRKAQTFQPSANVNALRSDQEIRSLPSQDNFDIAEIFLTKLNEFLESNEFLFSLNIEGLNVTLAENSHTPDSRADLMNVQIPKGKVNLSFNFNKKSAYIVDVYGFRIETSSKFKALHFLTKKVKNIIESGIEEDEKNIFFYDFLLKRGIVRNNMTIDDFKRYYSQIKGIYPM